MVYRQREDLLHNLHPAVALTLVGMVTLVAFVFSNPLFLLAVLLGMVTIIIAAGHFRDWLAYFRYSLILGLLIMVVDGICVHAGATTLAQVILPGGIQLAVNLQGLCYGAAMGVRLLAVVTAFCFYNCAIDPDAVWDLGRGESRSLTALVLTVRLFPLLLADTRRVIEVQRCRIPAGPEEKPWQHLRFNGYVLLVMLQSTLERAWQMAESMQARGYGAVRRSHYVDLWWRPRDYLVLAAVLMAVALAAVAVFSGWSGYSYYPRLAGFTGSEAISAGVMAVVLALPALINWGWYRWPWLQSKI